MPLGSKFKPGDRVQWLDEDLEGVVTGVDAGRILVRTMDGFEITASPDSIVHIPERISFPVPPEALASASDPDPKPGPSQRRDKRARYGPAMEVDLHIEKLHPNPEKLNTHSLLDVQLETARGQLEFAMRKRIQKIVFIHGVGEGVLKAELRTLFRRYEGLQVRDADFRIYGQGATEVFIPQDVFG